MPIRFLDKTAAIGRIQAVLANVSGSLAGTFNAAPGRTGTISAQLQDHSSAFVGIVQENANRTGTIGASLQNVTAALLGSLPSAAATNPFIADYLARASGPNVVWDHPFNSAAELNAFRWMNGVGNDPNAQGPSADNARWLQGAGPGGTNCIEFFYPSGVSAPTVFWWRPLAPMDTGSGKTANDPAASGTLTVRTWNPASSSATANFDWGWYGHPTYANADPTHFDGNELWLQVRCKADPNRLVGTNEDFRGGKFIWLTTAEDAQSLSGGEHVFWSYGHAGNQGTGRNYLRCYVHQTTGIGDFDPLDQEEPGTRIQPGSDVAEDWYYTGGWDTQLINVRLGQIGVTSGPNSTRLRVYAARDGETEYTKIWEQEYGIDSFEARNGLQALILSAYNNGHDFDNAFFHRFTHPILSKSFIPAPKVHNAATFPLLTLAAGLAPGQSVAGPSPDDGLNGLGTGSGSARQTVQWGNRFFYDHERRIAHLIGKDASAGGGDGARSNNTCNLTTGVWSTSGRFHIDGSVETGHIYESTAFDPKERTIYCGRWGQTYIQRWTVGSPLGSGWSTTATYGQHWMPDSTPHSPPLCWHPNLFGVGDGGLVIMRNINQSTDMEFLAWRRSTNTFHSIPGTQHDCTTSPQRGACEYVRSGDYVIGVCAFGNTYKIPAGSNGTLGTVTQLPNPPVVCAAPGSATSNGGVLIDDPLGRGGAYILEKCGTNRVWKLINNAWSLRPYTHPLPRGSVAVDNQFLVASCYPLGVFWCANQTGTPRSLIYRPLD